MAGALLLRGMILGVVAGLCAFAFATIFGEPQLVLAIAFEGAAHSGAGDAPPLISREMQAGLGLASGMVGYGAAIGGIFALVFAVIYGRLCTIKARGMAALLGVAAFVSTALVPQLKYPANPPAVGMAETISARTTLFFLVLILSVICMVVTGLIARRLWHERGGWSAGMIAGAVFVALTTVSFLALPSVSEIPEGFDPAVIWNFRISSLGIHLVLWLVLGLGFGAVAERLLEGPQVRRPGAV